MASIVALKAVYSIVIVVVHALGGFAPWLFTWRARSAPPVLACGMALSSGVMFAAGLLRLLPAAQRQSEPALSESPFPEYPLAPCIATAGFLLVLAVEQVAIDAPTERKQRCCSLATLYSSVAFLAALSIHSVLAGIGLGLQSNHAALHSVFGAIASHAAFEAMSLGTKLIRDGASFQLFAAIMTPFCCLTSAGVPIGVAASNRGSWTDLVLHAVVAGTFLYIGASLALSSTFVHNDVSVSHSHAHDLNDHQHAHSDCPQHLNREILTNDVERQKLEAHTEHSEEASCNQVTGGVGKRQKMLRFAFVCAGVLAMSLAELAHQHKHGDHDHSSRGSL